MAALQYPIVIADIPIRWDEQAWVPDASTVIEDMAHDNAKYIRALDAGEVELMQFIPDDVGRSDDPISEEDNQDGSGDGSGADDDDDDDDDGGAGPPPGPQQQQSPPHRHGRIQMND